MEKTTAALIEAVFEAVGLGAGFLPAALALGALGVYKTIMRRIFGRVKRNVGQAFQPDGTQMSGWKT